jgi:hypothetical protein
VLTFCEVITSPASPFRLSSDSPIYKSVTGPGHLVSRSIHRAALVSSYDVELVGLPQIGGIVVSELVALGLLPLGILVTWFVAAPAPQEKRQANHL